MRWVSTYCGGNVCFGGGNEMSQRDQGYDWNDWLWIILGAGIIVTGLWLTSGKFVAPHETIIIDARGGDARM